MPIYEYHCAPCNHKFEEFMSILRSMKDIAEPTHCPKCKKVAAKQLSVPQFSLRGLGWAKDNYGCKTTWSDGHKPSRKKSDYQ